MKNTLWHKIRAAFTLLFIFSGCRFFPPFHIDKHANNPKTLADVHVCIDALTQPSTFPPLQESIPKPRYKVLPNGTVQQIGSTQQALTSSNEFRWEKGATITVGFFSNQTTDSIISIVKMYAAEWMQFTSIKLQFVNDVNLAQVKVGFVADGTSCSWLGRSVINNPNNLPTMNFGWFDSKTPDADFQRTVRHEFGHVLGFEHEHQSPVSNIAWNKDSVYKYYLTGGWDSVKVDANIFEKYSRSFTNFSAYDPLSIMHYHIPAIFTTNGFSVGWNINFSDTDKAFAKRLYETSLPREPDVCEFTTGDDCDLLVVTINYPSNEVSNDMVTFQLELGSMNENIPNLTWWKEIGIPLLNNTEAKVFVASPSVFNGIQVPFSAIDVSKGFSFAKAKFLGVHTPLNFKWNVWQAIEPGCRVHFLWKRDRCN
jgi:hypothetical protein